METVSINGRSTPMIYMTSPKYKMTPFTLIRHMDDSC